ncbi:DNA replication and repair protein RecF [Candidatus Saccharibacteria bacterium]|nr:DNA replication and repair protein RecF [Candidatus Saccharibacteria bacterium]MBQ6375609.1 DNA replication and repair protein RecF [Candidatus Saccharibacteria bacterium]
MIIKSINLTNFRNHATYHLDFNPDTTLILGDNGWGKTSILEAIYILTRGKSFRATDPDIKKRDADFYRIELEYGSGEKTITAYDGTTKTFSILDKKSRRLPAKNKYPIVLFLPSDLNLISGSPSRRRDYFDNIFGQLSEDYNSSLSKYNKALRQRNELLKSDVLPKDALFSWNLMLAKYGSTISSYRAKFVDEINRSIGDIYHSIAKNSDSVSLLYQTELTAANEQKYLTILEQTLEKDHYLGHTSFGIHRDDIDFIFNGTTADGSASRGETRSIILALKFVEADIITRTLGKQPIVLLDDVFSELDETRQKCLVDNFKDHQVVITSVNSVN